VCELIEIRRQVKPLKGFTLPAYSQGEAYSPLRAAAHLADPLARLRSTKCPIREGILNATQVRFPFLGHLL
jgi:hypothetical protein